MRSERLADYAPERLSDFLTVAREGRMADGRRRDCNRGA
jgi:hypothetical protein